MYSCTDHHGNSIITSSPQDGMENCVLKDSYEDLTPAQRAAQQREIQADRQRLNVQADKYYSSKRQQESRNRQADKLLQTYKDIGFKMSPKNRDKIEKAAEVKAEQIRQGTDTPMTASEDAAFHADQDARQKEWEYESKMRKKEWEVREKQDEIDKLKRGW